MPHNLQELIPFEIGQLGIFGSSGNMFVTFISVCVLLFLVPMCLIFKKAGRSWWEALIPLYNLYIMTVIIGVPWWILIGFFVPFLNYVVGGYMYYHLSKRFGFDIPFTIGLVFLPFIFLPILGYGGAIYTAKERE